MSLNAVVIVFQVIVFLFAISAHESAHAWVADRCGDPTARMLGRVTLNPIRHIDVFGTLVFPVFCIVMGMPVFGWAKPTPVNTRNFRKLVKYDILTALAGPVSNMLVALISVLLLALMGLLSPAANQSIKVTASTFGGAMMETGTPLEPLIMLLYQAILINVLLAVFNVIPIPPLDGSHVIRHFLSERVLRVYDMVGIFAMLLLFLVGGRFIMMMMAPFLALFNSLLMRI